MVSEITKKDARRREKTLDNPIIDDDTESPNATISQTKSQSAFFCMSRCFTDRLLIYFIGLDLNLNTAHNT